ncbi:MAG: MMPL family transporter [Cyclobacteriaceae bacterium]|nr:MMPL family transporter [Cyclobacteriaceae bacterium]
MWSKLADFILKYRLPLILVLVAVTVFMGFKAQKAELNYHFAKVVPADDPDMVVFEQFKKIFGEDGSILAIGIKDSSVFTPDNFRKLKYMSDEIKSLPGITSVLSLPNLPRLVRDAKEKKFDVEQIFKTIPNDQHDLDSLLKVTEDQRFYSGQLINEKNGMILLLVSYDKSYLNSNKRIGLTEDILHATDAFTENTGIQTYFAGMPFVRSVVAGQVRDELELFLLYSALITAFIMLLFFRSWIAVVFPMITIIIVVIWVLGSLVLFDYKITLLTGLIPSIIVVIGIPNSIYLINKYHHEFLQHGDKIRAIKTVTQKIGLATLITNGTTAVGFGVLMFTDITILKEFGIIASLNVMSMFIVSIITMPIVFSYLPEPSDKHLKHLSFSPLKGVLDLFTKIVTNHRPVVFAITIVLVVLSAYGTYKIHTESHMIDDIPEDSRVKSDLHFFEDNFSGMMPLEIVVDTHKKRGVTNLRNLDKIDEFEKFLAAQPDISNPVSIISFIKAARQAYFNNNPDRYDLPKNNQEKNFILSYLKNQADSSGLLKAFVDSTGQKIRISLKIKDIGSKKMDSLINQVIRPKEEELFKNTGLTASITGSTLLFVKGNSFLINNLKSSFVLAFFVISIIMGTLFRNFRMILLSLIPNIIPLLFTAGLMGFTGIPLKPSTAIIFSIAFGIAVDNAIHFLAKYRQELYSSKFDVRKAVDLSMHETGTSMIYTAIILFAGFVIFTASKFGGTVALGLLTSITLLVAMFTNLLVLPSLLLTFDTGKRSKNVHPIIEEYDGVYEEDEEIELDNIKVSDNGEEKESINQNK